MLPPAPADPLKNGKRVRWIVEACLNRYDVPGAVAGCKSGDPAKFWAWESPVLVLH